MSTSIYDIAKRANVSASTVSRALQDHPRIAPATRKRIQRIAKELDYVPSTVARGLSANRTWTIGMIVVSMSDPFMGRVVEGVEQVAIDAGFNVFLSTSQNDREREHALIEAFQQRRVDGIIVIASHLVDKPAWYLDRLGLPMVVINEQNPAGSFGYVAVDDIQGARSAVEHLLGLGHRRIAYVGSANRARSNSYRRRGYEQALHEAGLVNDPNLVLVSDGDENHFECGERSLPAVQAASATAVFCYNDATAIGLLAACHAHGRRVPESLSIVGFDDIEMARYCVPGLTTIRQPRFELGSSAMRMMLALLDGTQLPSEYLACELIVRSTTAPHIGSMQDTTSRGGV